MLFSISWLLYVNFGSKAASQNAANERERSITPMPPEVVDELIDNEICVDGRTNIRSQFEERFFPVSKASVKDITNKLNRRPRGAPLRVDPAVGNGARSITTKRYQR